MLTREERDKLAKFLGLEFFHIGYFGAKDESSRQKELEQWMERVELNSIGDYYIDVEKDYWEEIKLFLNDTESPKGLFQIFGPGGLVEKAIKTGWLFRVDSYDKDKFAASLSKEIPTVFPYGYEEVSYEEIAPTIGLCTCKAILAVIEKEEV